MHIDATRWERIQTLFHGALELPLPERKAWLDVQTRDDQDLLRQVSTLLEEDARGATLLDRDLADVAGAVLDRPLPRAHAVGPYRILSVLGEGGMGVVYLAERADLGSRAAIKMLRDAWLSPARRGRFASEQRTLAQLSHPSIARLYDADVQEDGTPYFVMEYVDGIPLTAYCRTRACSVAERLRLLREVCDAVQFAHRHAIVHRDLKPSNVLVDAEGGVKLLDFGIAKQLDALDTPADQTKTMLRLMTPAYAAPEQIRGDPVGIHTDVYALGVILYELLTGRLPYDLSSKTPGQVESILLEQEPDRPSTSTSTSTSNSGSALPRVAASRVEWADLDVLCLTAMHKDPQRRYRTVEAFARDIDHYLAREPLEARPDSFGYRVGKFVRRNWREVAAASVVLATIVGLVAFYTMRLTNARDAALAEAARTQRIQGFMLNLFQGGDEAAGPADTLRVVTLVERGAQEARVLDAEPVVQADLYHTLGGIYQKMGNLPRADTLLRAAFEQRKILLRPEHPDIASSLVALGELRLAEANLEEAERLVRDGVHASGRLPENHPVALNAATVLGRVLQERGSYDEAIAVLDEAVRRQGTQAVTPDLSLSLTELANTHFYAGRYTESDSLNRMLLAMDRELYGERHPFVGDALINLGAVQFQLGNYQEAERYARDGLAIFTEYYGAEHYRTAGALTMVGRALVFQERWDDATRTLQRALAIRQRVFGAQHPLVASTLTELGSIALQNKDFAAAEAYYRRTLDIYRGVYGDQKHQLTGIALANLASVYMFAQRNVEAEPMFREAIDVFTAAQGPEHVNTAISQIKLGRVLTRQERYAEAEVRTRTGYEVLVRQANPAISFLKAARADLVIDYDALNQPEKAARFRAELADTLPPPLPLPRK